MGLDLKPLKDGDTVCVVGGGPGGASCAIALKRLADEQGRDVRVAIFEQKKFEENRQFNQCIGVLSPPLEEILANNFGLELPRELIVKEIKGYRLHSDGMSLDLAGHESGKTYAVHRSHFDAFMLAQAEKAGATVIHNRATGMEISPEDVLVYSEGENVRASAVVGAFGMDEGACKVFEWSTPYRQPDFLNTIITRLYPGEEFLREIGPTIQAFLLSFQGLEFGAVTPKLDHLSINIAGRRVSARVMLEFLRSEPVQRFLPPHQRRENPLHYFKGKFPIAPARNLCGDRYVMVGDAAGLIRPFKGKGINSACLTGLFAARCMMNAGVSRRAFERVYLKDCRVFTDDLVYGRVLRALTNLSTRFKFMDHILKIAEKDPVFMDCLFNCVSAHKTYKEIFRETASLSLGLSFAREFFNHFISRQGMKAGA
ncbi:MAG: NAD(P)/FAD-dependent oxidoreductase [Nitrospinae bacterium]|nr:NAD(P)/FAD-dependent oxidoreductase [Nitrospinota bacterium]